MADGHFSPTTETVPATHADRVFQGLLADMPSVGIHASYWVAVLCFMYLAWYGIKAKQLLDKQGISLDMGSASGH